MGSFVGQTTPSLRMTTQKLLRCRLGGVKYWDRREMWGQTGRSPGFRADCGADLDFKNPKETGHICPGQVTPAFRGGFLSEPS
jgi:hypothetical protein